MHLAFVLGLIFLVFRRRAGAPVAGCAIGLLTPGGIPVDWLLGLACAASVLYIPWIFDDLAFCVGNPSTMDVVMGSILFSLLEATRRSMGLPLPLIALGPSSASMRCWPAVPRPAAACGRDLGPADQPPVPDQPGHLAWPWGGGHLRVPFRLFGVMATRIGLGQLFLDIASSIAGRYAGGPAKVSVFGSAMFGMLSGSSVANAVTVGLADHPGHDPRGLPTALRRRRGGRGVHRRQITPPVLGAAAFLMIEFLGLPYQTIIAAAVVPGSCTSSACS